MFKIFRSRISRHTLYSTLAVTLIAGAAPASMLLTQPAMAQSNGGGGGGGGGGNGGGDGGGGGSEANPALDFILANQARQRRPHGRFSPSDIGGGHDCGEKAYRIRDCDTDAMGFGYRP